MEFGWQENVFQSIIQDGGGVLLAGNIFNTASGNIIIGITYFTRAWCLPSHILHTRADCISSPGSNFGDDLSAEVHCVEEAASQTRIYTISSPHDSAGYSDAEALIIRRTPQQGRFVIHLLERIFWQIATVHGLAQEQEALLGQMAGWRHKDGVRQYVHAMFSGKKDEKNLAEV